jgi:hypothetical protein
MRKKEPLIAPAWNGTPVVPAHCLYADEAALAPANVNYGSLETIYSEESFDLKGSIFSRRTLLHAVSPWNYVEMAPSSKFLSQHFPGGSEKKHENLSHDNRPTGLE